MLVKTSCLPIISATKQTDRQRGRYSHPGPPWYSLPLSARFGPYPLGGYRHPSYTCRQTCEKLCALYLSFPPIDRIGSDRLFRRWTARPCSRRLQRQKRGLELAAEHETGETPPWLCRRELLSNLWTGNHYHQPIQLLRYSRFLGYRGGEGTPVPDVSDFVLSTKLGPPSGNHRHCMSLILSSPIWSPWSQAHWMGQLPHSLGRSNSFRFGIAQRDGNRHVRRELLRRRSEVSSGIYS